MSVIICAAGVRGILQGLPTLKALKALDLRENVCGEMMEEVQRSSAPCCSICVLKL